MNKPCLNIEVILSCLKLCHLKYFNILHGTAREWKGAETFGGSFPFSSNRSELCKLLNHNKGLSELRLFPISVACSD